MQRKDEWKPTKFVANKRGFVPSSDAREVAPGSRYVVNIQVNTYAKAIREHARGRLLDLGCGKVPLYEVYRDRIEENYCVDWENTLHQNPFIDLRCNIGEGLPLDDESFDTILLTDVLEHISQPEVLFRHMARVLRPDGKIILGVPFFYWLHEEPYDFHRYTKFKLASFCKENGLDVVSLEAYGGAPEVLCDIAAKHLAFSRVVSTAHYSLSKRFTASWPVRIWSRFTADKWPLGYCLIAQKPVGHSGR